MTGWQFWIDLGRGTTTIVARPPRGPLVSLRQGAEAGGDDALVRALAGLLGGEPGQPVAAGMVSSVRLAASQGEGLRRRGDLLARALPGARVLVMHGGGGLVDHRRLAGQEVVASAPAAAAIALGTAAAALGFERLIGLDMGASGTALWCHGGAMGFRRHARAPGMELAAPGWDMDSLPLGGERPVDGVVGAPSLSDILRALGRLPASTEAEAGAGSGALSAAAAQGSVERAVAAIAAAIAAGAARRGHDLAGSVLACAGGTSSQLACPVAEALGLERILVPAQAGMATARGLGLAPLRVIRWRDLDLAPGADSLPALNLALADLEAQARAALERQGVERGDMGGERLAWLADGPGRPWRDIGFLATADLFAAMAPGQVVRAIAVVMSDLGAQGAEVPPQLPLSAPPAPGAAPTETLFHHHGLWGRAAILARRQLAEGQSVEGPALVVDPTTTIVVDPGWWAEAVATGALVLHRVVAQS